MSYLQKTWPLVFSVAVHAIVAVWCYTAYVPPKLLNTPSEYITVRLTELKTHKVLDRVAVKSKINSTIKSVKEEVVAPAVEPINSQVAQVDVQTVKHEEEIVPPSFNAEYLHNPPPEYPPIARRRGEQGRVLLRVTVSTSGEAVVVLVSESSGFDLLDQSAIQAVRAWRFVPARFNNHPVSADVTVPVRFTLES